MSKSKEVARVPRVNTKSYQLIVCFDSLGSETNDAATGSWTALETRCFWTRRGSAKTGLKLFFLTCKFFLLVFRSFLVLEQLHRDLFIIYEILLFEPSTPRCPFFLLTTGIRHDVIFILCFDWFFNFLYIDLWIRAASDQRFVETRFWRR